MLFEANSRRDRKAQMPSRKSKMLEWMSLLSIQATNKSRVADSLQEWHEKGRFRNRGEPMELSVKSLTRRQKKEGKQLRVVSTQRVGKQLRVVSTQRRRSSRDRLMRRSDQREGGTTSYYKTNGMCFGERNKDRCTERGPA